MDTHSKNNSDISVLLVDDDVDFLLQMEVLLKANEFNVTTASSQKQAEEALNVIHPDIAVVDLMMEHADGGFALCYHIKKRFPGTPVIIVTAVSSETGIEFDASTQEEKSWVRADAMLTKPVRLEQLLAEIDRFCKK